VLELRSATDFDPFGTEPQEEHPELTQLAIDGNPTGSAWSTENYDVGLDKLGVGIYVNAGKEVEVGAVELTLATAGSDVEIRSAPGQQAPPEELDGWEVIGEQADAGTDVRIETPGAATSRFYLVWFTKLPRSESGPFNIEVADIRLIGS
jgi:hypothetical protein